MATITCSTNVPYPPARAQLLSEFPAGTITNIACGGPCVATVYSAASTALMSINSPGAISMPVSLAFSGGAPIVQQSTGSTITFTLVE